VLHQRYKDLWFALISKLTLPNYYLRRMLPQNGGPRHLHLGSGPKYLPNFINIDANPTNKLDIWLDVRCGLPFADDSVDSIYTTHVLEHLYPDELQRLLADCYRVLKPGSGMRIIVPSLSSAIRAYHQQRTEWFNDHFPRHFDSLGGRFSNFVFCDGQHRTAFDFSYFNEVLRKSGFTEVVESAEGQSRLYAAQVPPYTPGDDRDLPHSLYVEAFKAPQ